MILPALGSARTKARLATCKANLKSIGQSVAIYYTDGLDTKYPDGGDLSSTSKALNAASNDQHKLFDIPSSIITCPVVDPSAAANIYRWVHKTTYTGSSTQKLAEDNTGASPHGDDTKKYRYQYLYEDGSVDTNGNRN